MHPTIEPSLKLIASDNSTVQGDPTTWQSELRHSCRSLGELLDTLQISQTEQTLVFARDQAAKDFPLQVTPSFINRIKKGDVNDPLLKQILPDAKELKQVDGFSIDPLQETSSNPLPGLLHKYQSRALLTIASSCAVNCRYCFRRHFPYKQNNPSKAQWMPAIEYLSDNSSINEVIYSGGDPLMVNDLFLAWLNEKLNTIPSLQRLRIHSRLPVVLPNRITPAFIDSLNRWSRQTVMVIHCNHPREIDSSVEKAVQLLKAANITVLNQSVLLKGINDNSDVLAELSETLFNIGVMPYYLHQLDAVQGAAHFEVDETRAKQLQEELLGKLAGFLVPKFVREIAGEPNKTPL